MFYAVKIIKLCKIKNFAKSEVALFAKTINYENKLKNITITHHKNNLYKIKKFRKICNSTFCKKCLRKFICYYNVCFFGLFYFYHHFGDLIFVSSLKSLYCHLCKSLPDKYSLYSKKLF